jgi:hypothetical protein
MPQYSRHHRGTHHRGTTPESSCQKVLDEIKPYNYRIFEKNDKLPDELFKTQLMIPVN